MKQGRISSHTETFLPIIHDAFILFTIFNLLSLFLFEFFLSERFLGRLLTSGDRIIDVLLYKHA